MFLLFSFFVCPPFLLGFEQLFTSCLLSLTTPHLCPPRLLLSCPCLKDSVIFLASVNTADCLLAKMGNVTYILHLSLNPSLPIDVPNGTWSLCLSHASSYPFLPVSFQVDTRAHFDPFDVFLLHRKVDTQPAFDLERMKAYGLSLYRESASCNFYQLFFLSCLWLSMVSFQFILHSSLPLQPVFRQDCFLSCANFVCILLLKISLSPLFFSYTHIFLSCSEVFLGFIHYTCMCLFWRLCLSCSWKGRIIHGEFLDVVLLFRKVDYIALYLHW